MQIGKDEVEESNIIFMINICEKCEQYNDMIIYLKKLIQIRSKLTISELH